MVDWLGHIDLEQLRVLGRVLLAAALGAVVGLERELAAKPAGLRTQTIVAASAALLVSLGITLPGTFEDEGSGGWLRVDPLRTIEAVVTGVSFLGAGTIIRGRGDVEGLTTAATLLLSAAIGIAVAISRHTLAVGVAVATLFVLRGLAPLERLVRRR